MRLYSRIDENTARGGGNLDDDGNAKGIHTQRSRADGQETRDPGLAFHAEERVNSGVGARFEKGDKKVHGAVEEQREACQRKSRDVGKVDARDKADCRRGDNR